MTAQLVHPATGLKFNPGNHSYRLDGKAVRGVTGLISGGTAKDALIQWSANMVAQLVTDHPEDVEEMRRHGNEFLYNELRFAPKRKKEDAGARGTEVHALAEQIMHGHEVDVPQRLLPYVSGYVKFLDEWNPEPIFTEAPVASRKHWYAGTADSLCRINGGLYLLDWKTSNGVYGDTAMQAAAYARAEFYVQDGREIRMPIVDGIAVAHITPDGTHLYDLGDIDLAFDEFLHVAHTAKTADRRKKLIGSPMERI